MKVHGPIFALLLSWSTAATGEPLECQLLSFTHDLSDYVGKRKWRILFLVRHGHAEQEGKDDILDSKEGVVQPGLDKKRELDKRGKRDVKALGKMMSNLDLGDTIIYASGAVRTRDTARAVADRIKAKSQLMIVDDAFYHTSYKNYLKLLRDSSNDFRRHAMIVGHEGQLMKGLSDFIDVKSAFVPTAGVVAIAIKTPTWESFFSEPHQEALVFAWSPTGTETIATKSRPVSGEVN